MKFGLCDDLRQVGGATVLFVLFAVYKAAVQRLSS